MKSFCLSLIALSFFLCSFSFPVKENTSPIIACDNIPELNKQMFEFVKGKLNKKVGRGECWDLAAQGLNSIGANWDKDYVYGKEVDPWKDCVYPGDVIQFEGIKIQYQKGNTTYTEEMDHHTAVVYKVNGKGSYVVAEQNTSVHGKKVGLSNLELNNVLRGSYKFYQPVK